MMIDGSQGVENISSLKRLQLILPFKIHLGPLTFTTTFDSLD